MSIVSDLAERLDTLTKAVLSEPVTRITNTKVTIRPVTLKGKAGIGNRHSHAVVNDLNACLPGIDKKDIDPRGASINGVLNEFLDHRRWPLDHLPRRYLVGY